MTQPKDKETAKEKEDREAKERESKEREEAKKESSSIFKDDPRDTVHNTVDTGDTGLKDVDEDPHRHLFTDPRDPNATLSRERVTLSDRGYIYTPESHLHDTPIKPPGFETASDINERIAEYNQEVLGIDVLSDSKGDSAPEPSNISPSGSKESDKESRSISMTQPNPNPAPPEPDPTEPDPDEDDGEDGDEDDTVKVPYNHPQRLFPAFKGSAGTTRHGALFVIPNDYYCSPAKHLLHR